MVLFVLVETVLFTRLSMLSWRVPTASDLTSALFPLVSTENSYPLYSCYYDVTSSSMPSTMQRHYPRATMTSLTLLL